MSFKIIFLIVLFSIFTTHEVAQVQGQTIDIPKYTTGTISWLPGNYSVNSYGVIEVIDKDMIINPGKINQLQVLVWSDSDANQIPVTLYEIHLGSDTFQGKVYFTNNSPSNGNTINVSEGDRVTAQYIDYFDTNGEKVYTVPAIIRISNSSSTTVTPSFEIGVSTNQFNILSGQSASSQINIITSNDIQSVTLSCDTTIPSDSGSCIVSPSTIGPGQVAQFTINTDKSISASEYKGTITGTSGNIVQQIPFSVVIGSRPDFSIKGDFNTKVGSHETFYADTQDPNKMISSFSWVVDDGQSQSGDTLDYTFQTSGSHTVTLIAHYTDNTQLEKSETIYVEKKPETGPPSWVAPAVVTAGVGGAIAIVAKIWANAAREAAEKAARETAKNQVPIQSPIQSIEIEIKGGFEK